MKPSSIKVGATYCNRGAGKTLRQVTRIGRDVQVQWLGSGEPPAEPVVEFQQLDWNGNLRYTDSLYLSSFARWAGKEAGR